MFKIIRSRTFAGLSVGFKDQAAAIRVGKKNQQVNAQKNLTPEFEFEMLEPSTPPPPELPMNIIQAIATQQCQIPPSRSLRMF